MLLQVETSLESAVELASLAAYTQSNPAQVFGSFMRVGRETVRARAQMLRTVHDAKAGPALNASDSRSKTTEIDEFRPPAAEPRPEHWRRALEFDTLPAEFLEASTTVPMISNQPRTTMAPVKARDTSRGVVLTIGNQTLVDVRKVWIQTDRVCQTNAHWYLTDQTTGCRDDPETEPEYSFGVEPNAQSIIECVAQISKKTWVDKAQFLEALMPVIEAVAWTSSDLPQQ